MQSQIPMEIEDESNHYSILEADDRVIKKVIIRIKDKNE